MKYNTSTAILSFPQIQNLLTTVCAYVLFSIIGVMLVSQISNVGNELIMVCRLGSTCFNAERPMLMCIFASNNVNLSTFLVLID